MNKERKKYFKLDDSALIIVDITVVGSTENGDDNRKFIWTIPFMHLIPIKLRFMCT